MVVEGGRVGGSVCVFVPPPFYTHQQYTHTVCVSVQFSAILVVGAELSCFCYGGTDNNEGHL